MKGKHPRWLRRAVWDFGCPGHGKGIWDGIGGAVKSTLRNDILNCKRTDGKGRAPLSKSGKLSTPLDCFEHYDTKKKSQAASDSAEATRFVALWADATEIARPKTEETYDRFEGIREARQILAGPSDGVVAWRKFACWCPACFRAYTRGEGSMDSTFKVRACCNHDRPEYVWHEQAVRRIDASTITQERMRAQAEGRKLAGKLGRADIGKFVAVQNRGDENDPSHFWIGRLVDAGDRHPVMQTCAKSQKIAGMRFGPGDHVVAVEWFERCASDGEDRTFYPGCAGMDLFNSTELRLLNPKMVQTVFPRQLRGQNASDRRQLERWVLPAEDESKILAWCW